MHATAEAEKKTWTEGEIMALPNEGFICEVVDGELVMSPKNNLFHGSISVRLTTALSLFVRQHRLGVVLDSSTGFWMFNRNCRAPDVSFVARARMAALGFAPKENRFFPGAPDLAVEILSTNNTRAEMDECLRDFFPSGCQLAWIINPETESVEVCRSLTQRSLKGSGAFLEAEDILPGFKYPIADLFKEWDWD